ncbi:hypothetical protein Bca52824_052413 [Brassica carinata]|uniref:Uncharacterized protein n=1 Tax=Brassica carinata TaxID=52824 RepID=A0A8X7R779_BRACI|nr:hypothetical protein Bca52824_052413 [Brassica carinata]
MTINRRHRRTEEETSTDQIESSGNNQQATDDCLRDYDDCARGCRRLQEQMLILSLPPHHNLRGSRGCKA